MCDRVKTTQNKTLHTINTIREAMDTQYGFSPYRNGRKISFRYTSYSVTDVHQLIDRHDGKVYTVSPYALVINNGDYYMIAFDDASEEIRHYRVDRMRDVHVLEEGRNYKGRAVTAHMKSYVRRTFSMFSGECQKVEMRFENSLLDAVIDKFGVGFGAEYRQDGDSHFIVTMEVEVSDQFFAWMCGFRKQAEIIAPEKVKNSMKKFLSEIQEKYE
jgi:predicted DNA-binding transcriptional regulator YafY